jgi:hypothetical protein
MITAAPRAMIGELNLLLANASRLARSRFVARPIGCPPPKTALSLLEIQRLIRERQMLTASARSILELDFSGQYAVLEYADGEFYVDELGAGMHQMRAWARQVCMPLAFRLLPDLAYGRWLNAEYSKLFRSRTDTTAEIKLRLEWGGQTNSWHFFRHTIQLKDEARLLMIKEDIQERQADPA